MKNLSSAPNTSDGRSTAARGNAARTAASPAALVRPYSLGLAASAPIADTCTSRCAPAAAAWRATRPAPSACTAANCPGLASASSPTRLTTSSAPSTARRTASSWPSGANHGTICPTRPIGRSDCASSGSRPATRTTCPAAASRWTT